MIYEATVTFIVTDENGKDKNCKESVILENSDTFTEVEGRMYDLYDGNTGLDVIAIKRSQLKEIANSREDDNDSIFIAEVCDIFTDDKGKEKKISYSIAFFSANIDKAKTFIDEYIKQGYDMKLRALEETNFVDVI